MRGFRSFAVCALAAGLASAQPQPATAPQPAAVAQPGQRITPNFKDADITQIAEAVAAGAAEILLDNFTADQCAQAVRLVRNERAPVTLEASGRLTLASARSPRRSAARLARAQAGQGSGWPGPGSARTRAGEDPGPRSQ